MITSDSAKRSDLGRRSSAEGDFPRGIGPASSLGSSSSDFLDERARVMRHTPVLRLTAALKLGRRADRHSSKGKALRTGPVLSSKEPRRIFCLTFAQLCFA